MNQPLIPKEVIDREVNDLRINNPGAATIRELVALVNAVESKTGIKFVRMEMGVPGLPPSSVGVEAEIEALKNGVASDYPMVDGIKPLKFETSRFIKSFMDIDISPRGCIPTVGIMQGTYAAFMAVGNRDKKKDTVLFVDPGFPVQKQQLMVMGMKYISFDVFNYRGTRLREKLTEYLIQGNISSIIYSNPNNPTWICLTEEELGIIGDLANKYDVIILEDLAYFGMDFRKDLYTPGISPFQPTVARYTNNYILFLSASKIFSYAGQRCAVMCVSDHLFDREFPGLMERFHASTFGNTVVQRILYALTSGISHSAQYALAAMFKAASDGTFNFISNVKEYGEKAAIMKRLFIENGFTIVYDEDQGEPIADGFYFTIGYPGMSGVELVSNLLLFGVSAIALTNTGSEREGLRACVSHVYRSQFEDLGNRLARFDAFYKSKS
ncbi:MAG TPA: aminotransferase [Bacteroidales bacterium]|nr:aminotransferase [Bacteroidales bacterium]